MPIPPAAPASPVSVTASATKSLASLMPADWRKALAAEVKSPSFAALDTFLQKEEATSKVFPPRSQIFAAMKATPLADAKVVIIGQDPYPTAGNANGLSFSVNKGMKLPGSLRNIFTGLSKDTGLPAPKTGDLTPWAERGVLLLNTVLTVSEGKPNSHKGKGWEQLTEAALKKVNEQPGPVVFLCFGAQAKDMAERLVDKSKHTIIAEPHPSPLNGNKFVEAVAKDHIFTRTNELLTAGGRGAIDWSLPG